MLLAQATIQEPNWINLVAQGGITVAMAWFMRYLLTVYIPKKDSEMTKERLDFLAALREQHKECADEREEQETQHRNERAQWDANTREWRKQWDANRSEERKEWTGELNRYSEALERMRQRLSDVIHENAKQPKQNKRGPFGGPITEESKP
jgi:dsDNA-specific endonuclease/ATPase MutS2